MIKMGSERLSFYGNQSGPARAAQREATLYPQMRELYRARGYLEQSTLLIGAGDAREARGIGFKGVFLDKDPEAVKIARNENPGNGVVYADAAILPFADRSFDDVIVSLLLSRLAEHRPEAAPLALSEAGRVARNRVLVIDTTRYYEKDYMWLLAADGRSVEKADPYPYVQPGTNYGSEFNLAAFLKSQYSEIAKAAETFTWVIQQQVDYKPPNYDGRSRIEADVEAYEILLRS